MLSLGQAELLPGLVQVDQQHVFHEPLQLPVERRMLGSTPESTLFPMAQAPEVDAAVDAVYRSEWGRIVATLIRLVGDFDVAEDAAQEAFAAAVSQWRDSGVPEFPRAWIIQTARSEERRVGKGGRERGRGTVG